MYYFCVAKVKIASIDMFKNYNLHFTLLISFLITNFSFVSSQDIELGESLFSSNCASCHYVGPEEKKLIGPGLGSHTIDKYSKDWLYSWIKNSSELIASGDELAVAVYEEYNKLQMTAFPQFSNEDIDNILAYVQVRPEEDIVSSNEDLIDNVSDNSFSSESIFVFITSIIILFSCLLTLIKAKNLLKISRGQKPINIFSGINNFIKSNPAIIVFFSIFVILFCLKTIWDGLLTVGVQQGYQPTQPIAFSHKLHAGMNGVDCNYCHSGARHSKSALIPSANVCMNCHTYINEGQISGKTEIAKIYAAIGFDPETRTYIDNYIQKPIKWVRIHNLPDLAYFNHAQHVNAGGLECQTCHGPIEEMEVVEQYSPLTMGWCIECHREEKVNTDNDYYHEMNKKWVEKYHGEDINVNNIGGLECGKCHY